jgi:hypothetical protein
MADNDGKDTQAISRGTVNKGTSEGARSTGTGRTTTAVKVWAYAVGAWKKETKSESWCSTGMKSGYDHVFYAASLENILQQLKQRGLRGKVGQLSILAHGVLETGGTVQIRLNNSSSDMLTLNTLQKYKSSTIPELKKLRWFLTPSAVVVFYACTAGQGKDGGIFLRELSSKLPGRLIVAFTTYLWLGVPNIEYLAGEVKDTNQLAKTAGMEDLKNYRRKPNLDINSVHAKWARNGKLKNIPGIKLIDSVESKKEPKIIYAHKENKLWEARCDVSMRQRILRELDEKYKDFKVKVVWPNDWNKQCKINPKSKN